MADKRFHHNKGPFTIADICKASGCSVSEQSLVGILINDVAPLDSAGQGHLAFLDNVKYISQLSNSKAMACIMAPKMVERAPDGMICLTSDTPQKSDTTLIHPTAVVSSTAEIGEGTIIEANSVISDGVIIGKNSHIGANVTVSHAVIGDGVRIHNGVCIGQDGFGFAIDASGFTPVPQLGRVVIGDHVNIGANTCIDRGAGPDTIIGAGTIIDNLVQIGHNVKIGKGCIIVSQVGISGSTEIDDYCVFGGQAGVAGHLKIGKGVQVGAQSGVTKDIGAGEKVMGFPARPIREFWKEMAQIKKLLSKQ